ncbi:MAG: sulfatase family protein [Candidatus Sumerlaeaceae bacterium]
MITTRPLIGLLFAMFASTACAAASKPNVLFVLTDDQRWDALGVVQREMGERGRFPWLETPNMDRLAAGGVRFRNAFVTSPLCAPSRAVFMTGRYNHVNGVANNHTFFPGGDNTLQSQLHDAGYITGHFGKWHMGGQRGKRPGFDYSASFIGQGKYWNCPFEINGETTQTQGWVDDVSTSFTIAWIREQKDKPFFAMVGYKAPHGPHDPPERAKNRFPDAEARPVPNLHTRAIFRVDEQTTVPRKRAGGANLPHFRSLSAVDDSLGELLAALDDLGLTDNTVVVFAGDNGYYHGEHGIGDKRSLYEESLRIPFLVRYPNGFPKGKTNDSMVLNMDLAPTLLELAGAGIPKQMQGKSLLPLLTGKNVEWRNSFLAEYFEEKGFPTTPNVVAVRTADAKLIQYPGHDEWTELFDLRRDPYETKNLIGEAQSRDLLKRMQSEFDRQVKTTEYRMPDYADNRGTTVTAEAADAADVAKPGKQRKRKLR